MRPLNDRDLEVLETLVYMRYESTMKRLYEGGSAPLDFGGSNGSHHGKTALKLVKHGFVEARKRGKDWGDVTTRDARGSNVYRATPAGREAIRAHRTLKNGEKLTSAGNVRGKGGSLVPSSKYVPLTADEIADLRRACHLDMPVDGKSL